VRRAIVSVHGVPAGVLQESPDRDGGWRFAYDEAYAGPPVSLTMPVRPEPYDFDRFPAVFEGWLPEGLQLEALLRMRKLDRDDLFGQLAVVGHDLVGAVTVREPT
jgi:serine/threonine-protein kinase HipA